MAIALGQSRNNRTALLAGAIAVAMVGLSFAAVPLYRIFCETTGFGGTTQRASVAQADAVQVTGKPMTIRFDANHRNDLPWDFYPEKPTQKIQVGKRNMAIFVAKNLTARPITGTARFNVTPEQAGRYFNKIQCFCFNEQTLAPGQEVRMPVVYFVDPKIDSDPDARDIQEITLSYTFYPVDEAGKGG